MNYEGEWHDVLLAGFQATYLYKNGDQCSELSGGWSAYGYKNAEETTTPGGAPAFSLGTQYMEIGTIGTMKTGIVSMGKSIDLTNYSTLRFKYNLTTSDNLCRCNIIVFSPLANNYTWKQIWSHSVGDNIEDLDISTISGQYYIGVRIFNNTSTTITTSMKIYEISLS